MKRFLTIALALALAVPAPAQYGFKPLESWPYLYESFTEGAAVTFRGEAVKYDRMNVNVADGKLHYVRNDDIMVADMGSVRYVTIGQDLFANVQGRLMRVLRETDHGGVLLSTEVDVEELNKVSIGYGKSAIASTQNVSGAALEEAGSFNTGIVGRSLSASDADKYSGSELPLRETRYLVVDGFSVKAFRKDVLGFPSGNPAAVKEYIKKNKVKFNNVDDLASLVEFLHTLKNEK